MNGNEDLDVGPVEKDQQVRVNKGNKERNQDVGPGEGDQQGGGGGGFRQGKAIRRCSKEETGLQTGFRRRVADFLSQAPIFGRPVVDVAPRTDVSPTPCSPPPPN